MRDVSSQLRELVDALANVIDMYMELHPDLTADEAASALSYVHGALFRLASNTPASKLN